LKVRGREITAMVATGLVRLSKDQPVDVGASAELCVGTPEISSDGGDRKGWEVSEGGSAFFHCHRWIAAPNLQPRSAHLCLQFSPPARTIYLYTTNQSCHGSGVLGRIVGNRHSTWTSNAKFSRRSSRPWRLMRAGRTPPWN